MTIPIEEGISKYLFGYTKPVKKNDIIMISDKMMKLADDMDKFLNNVTDNQKREIMKKNVSMMMQLMVDNLEIYNDWLKKQSREMR